MPNSRIQFPNLTLTFLACVMCAGSVHAQSASSRTQIKSGYNPDGVLQPWKQSDVACAASGLVTDIYVKVGARVEPHTPLAKLDSANLELQFESAKRQAEFTGRLNAARAEVTLQERRIEALKQARLQQHSRQSELERAQADYSIALARLQEVEDEVEILKLQALRLEQQIAERTVLAPLKGIVVEVHKELGEFVAPNSPEVVRIVDVSKLRANFFLILDEVRRIPEDRNVTVRLDDYTQIQAKIEHISPVADSESGLIEVRVIIDNPTERILGSRCSLLLPPKAKPKAGPSSNPAN